MFLYSSSIYAQLHHQTIGALGGSQIKSNYYVSHSVGQSSVVGTSQLNSTLISQGYQQLIFNEYILEPAFNLHEVKFYPNPFSTHLTFELSLDYENIQITIIDITAKKLIQYCGSPEAIFKESKAALSKIEGIGTHAIKHIHESKYLKAAEDELSFVEQNAIEALYFEDSNYPFKLKHCIDGPIVLFQKGNINWDTQPIISVVGTRKLTTYGLAQCKKIIETLAVFNPIIVSGFAYGTDIAAHKFALKHQLQTVGCMAQGLQHTYPKSHLKYRNPIENQGGFVTDFWSTAVMDPSNFLRRNRLIAGLSEATIVIESAEKGGSLATASMAFGYNREVFALPGRITDSQSQGCLNLIKTKNAHLVSNPADIPYILNWSLETQQKVVQKKLFVELDSDEKIIYNYLKKENKSALDVIAIACEMPTSKVAYLLLNLELKGVCRPLPGKEFELV